jgi:hypothetical protein
VKIKSNKKMHLNMSSKKLQSSVFTKNAAPQQFQYSALLLVLQVKLLQRSNFAKNHLKK